MQRDEVPDFLSHYYARSLGPFRNLSDLSPSEAATVMDTLRQEGRSFASRRPPDYLEIRRELEDRVRAHFIAKGGNPQRVRPHYMLLGACDWLKSWYDEPCELRIALSQFESSQVSFTYGDLFPAMRYADGKPYRQQVYTLDELPALVARFGLPQRWNADGSHGPDRYIEAEVWDDAPLAAVVRTITTCQP